MPLPLTILLWTFLTSSSALSGLTLCMPADSDNWFAYRVRSKWFVVASSANEISTARYCRKVRILFPPYVALGSQPQVATLDSTVFATVRDILVKCGSFVVELEFWRDRRCLHFRSDCVGRFCSSGKPSARILKA